jgi:hypothetical protein
MDRLGRWVRALGAMRLALLALALIGLIFVPPPGTRAVFTGWPMVTTVVTPVLAPLVFLSLLLDALMARVFSLDANEPTRRRLQIAIVANLTAAAILLIRWLPYYAALRA